ncbi:MAG: hypothetical protein HY434_01700 [Candidatus Liptonbacteria bacterium]|nr:hypothetical protein [Candidatus Liptonbacteria bacterium]
MKTLEPVRNVTVVALVDGDDINTPSNLDAVKKAVEFSSEILVRDFRISLKLVAIDTWEFPKGKEWVDMDASLRDIVKIVRQKPAGADIVLAYTAKPIFSWSSEEIDGEQVGVYNRGYGWAAKILGNAALVAIYKNTGYATLHEIYHLFGAYDTYYGGGEGIMRRLDTTEIDRENFDRILQNRSRKF